MKFVHFIYKSKSLFIKTKNKKQLLFSNFKINILCLYAFILIVLFMIYPFLKNFIVLNNKKLLNNEINIILNNINKNIILCQKGILINDILKSISNPLIILVINDCIKNFQIFFKYKWVVLNKRNAKEKK